MLPAATTTFTVVFTMFVVAALVLIVLTLRFLVRQASASRNRWLGVQQDGEPDEDEGEEDEGEDEETR